MRYGRASRKHPSVEQEGRYWSKIVTLREVAGAE